MPLFGFGSELFIARFPGFPVTSFKCVGFGLLPAITFVFHFAVLKVVESPFGFAPLPKDFAPLPLRTAKPSLLAELGRLGRDGPTFCIAARHAARIQARTHVVMMVAKASQI
jgi:hypothetical protein